MYILNTKKYLFTTFGYNKTMKVYSKFRIYFEVQKTSKRCKTRKLIKYLNKKNKITFIVFPY